MASLQANTRSLSKRLKLTNSGLYVCCPGHQLDLESLPSDIEEETSEIKELRKGICFLKKVPRDALADLLAVDGKIEQGTQCEANEEAYIPVTVTEIDGGGSELLAINRGSETLHIATFRVEENDNFNGQFPDPMCIVFCRLCARGFKTERSLSVHLARKHNEVQSSTAVDSD